MESLFKITVLGKFGSGKTSIINQFTVDRYAPYHEPVIEDYVRKKITVDGNSVSLEIYDFDPEEEFSIMRDQYIRDADGFIIVLQINSNDFLDDIKCWYELIYRAKDVDYENHIPIIVVGSKNDLENERQLNRKVVELYLKTKEVPYIECSAKTGNNVNELFDILTRDILVTQDHSHYFDLKNKKTQKGCIVI